jgi:transcriptional antiterminator RfaH
MAYWAVARTLPRRESVAAERLNTAGFETFAPETKTGRGEAPLFPGYLFVRIVARWRAVDRTIGIIGLIKFGEVPAKCPDAEIAKLQGQLDADGLVSLPHRPPKPARPTPGAQVRIAAGPFRGFTAIYAGMTARDRERVLIDLLGRQALVELRTGQIFQSA